MAKVAAKTNNMQLIIISCHFLARHPLDWDNQHTFNAIEFMSMEKQIKLNIDLDSLLLTLETAVDNILSTDLFWGFRLYHMVLASRFGLPGRHGNAHIIFMLLSAFGTFQSCWLKRDIAQKLQNEQVSGPWVWDCFVKNFKWIVQNLNLCGLVIVHAAPPATQKDSARG